MYDAATDALRSLARDAGYHQPAPAAWFSHENTPALRELREAIRQDPEDAGIHFHLGLELLKLARFDEAELRFTQTISIDRHHAQALACLGHCRSFFGDHVEALRLLSRAQELCPDDVRISLLLAKTAGAAAAQGPIIDVCAAVPLD